MCCSLFGSFSKTNVKNFEFDVFTCILCLGPYTPYSLATSPLAFDTRAKPSLREIQIRGPDCGLIRRLRKLKRVLFVFLRWIPESPRWLVANNRLDEAHSLLMKYAANNGVDVDAKYLKHVISEVKKADVRKDDTRMYGSLDLFRTPKLRKRIIICCVNW